MEENEFHWNFFRFIYSSQPLPPPLPLPYRRFHDHHFYMIALRRRRRNSSFFINNTPILAINILKLGVIQAAQSRRLYYTELIQICFIF